MWCLMLCKEKIMRSSLFKPVIMPGRFAMWREETLSWELRRLKTRGLELAAVSTEAQQLGHRTGGGLVLTCNPDPGLLLIPLWSHYGVVRMSLVPGPEHSIRHSRDDGRLDQRERESETTQWLVSWARPRWPRLAWLQIDPDTDQK